VQALETMVRMGEHAVSKTPGGVLVSLGLGSCIGLALVARGGVFAGLAHVMLPDSRDGGGGATAKFADTAVPLLVAELARLGVPRARLSAAIVGGAQMFSFGSAAGLDIGRRNEEAVRDALAEAAIPVAAARTRGTTGRTIRVHVGSGLVTVKDVGGAEVPLLEVA
jgi:chemotaxis protein CheD